MRIPRNLQPARVLEGLRTPGIERRAGRSTPNLEPKALAQYSDVFGACHRDGSTIQNIRFVAA